MDAVPIKNTIIGPFMRKGTSVGKSDGVFFEVKSSVEFLSDVMFKR